MKAIVIKLFSVACITFCWVSHNYLIAQIQFDYKKNGDQYFAAKDYYSAAIYYEQFLGKNKRSGKVLAIPYTIQKQQSLSQIKNKSNNVKLLEVYCRIGDCYRNLHHYSEAIKWYQLPATTEDFVMAKLWLGVCEKATQQLDSASKYLQLFLKQYSVNDAFKQMAKSELASLHFIEQQLQKNELNLYSINRLPINSYSADYAASIVKDRLYFTSSRFDSSAPHSNKVNYQNKLYSTSVQNELSIIKFPIDKWKDVDYGTSAFTPNGLMMFFTVWKKTEGNNLATIYCVERTENGWSVPKQLNEQVNQFGYSSQQPYVTSDGKYLLFSSNKPGGFGNFDLYIAPLNHNEVGTSKNLGNIINTQQDEQSCFYQSNTNTLVFASNGRVGMGGFDFYTSIGNLVTNTFEEPYNMGYPINSLKDELYFFTTSSKKLFKETYISSDRNSDCCLQLFSIEKKYPIYISGKIRDCVTKRPITNALVSINLLSEEKTIQTYTNSNGDYTIFCSNIQPIKIEVAATNFFPNSLNYSMNDLGENDTIDIPTLCLESLLKDTTIMLVDTMPIKNMPLVALFNFNESTLSNQTKVLLDTLFNILQREPSLEITINGYTDNVGTKSYNLKLSTERASVCKKYLLEKGISANRINTIGNGACCFALPENNLSPSQLESARSQNRRVTFNLNLMHL